MYHLSEALEIMLNQSCPTTTRGAISKRDVPKRELTKYNKQNHFFVYIYSLNRSLK